MAEVNELVGQDEIERLLSDSMAGTPSPTFPQTAASLAPPGHSPATVTQPAAKPDVGHVFSAPSDRPGEPPPRPSVKETGIAQTDMEALLHQAEKALASIEQGSGEDIPSGVAPFHWEELSVVPANAESASLDLIRDVELDVSIELGRTQMYLEDVLKLRRGAVVTLDKLAGDPVDVFVNGRLVARGEVLVLNDNFCVRVAELVAGVNSG
jgi:flagellar motor switch protein FliN/FliY